MKLTSRLGVTFALLVISLTFLASTTLAYDRPQPRTERTATIHATTTNTVQYSSVTTKQNGVLRTTRLYAFTDDYRTLRSNHFNMPDPTEYVVSVSHGYANTIRRARIKRKGSIQG